MSRTIRPFSMFECDKRVNTQRLHCLMGIQKLPVTNLHSAQFVLQNDSFVTAPQYELSLYFHPVPNDVNHFFQLHMLSNGSHAFVALSASIFPSSSPWSPRDVNLRPSPMLEVTTTVSIYKENKIWVVCPFLLAPPTPAFGVPADVVLTFNRKKTAVPTFLLMKHTHFHLAWWWWMHGSTLLTNSMNGVHAQ